MAITELSISLRNLSSLIESFNEYINSIEISDIIEGALSIEFALWPYDLLDKDLDFDEAYYAGLCNHFKRWLHNCIKQLAITDNVEVTLIENLLIFRDQLQFKSKCIYVPISNSMVKIIKEEYEQ
jgi:hypothetical protein